MNHTVDNEHIHIVAANHIGKATLFLFAIINRNILLSLNS